jgi:preprotein translocase subunit YajC
MGWVTGVLAVVVIALSAFQMSRRTGAQTASRSDPRLGLAMGGFLLIGAVVRLTGLGGVTGDLLEAVSIFGLLWMLILTIRQQQRNMKAHLDDLEAKRLK